jgi:hypothetical protein
MIFEPDQDIKRTSTLAAFLNRCEALPKTRSIKTTRRIVRAAGLGEDTGDLSSISNPEAMEAIAALRKDKA